MTATDLYYDPYDYEIDADPYPIWKRLRDEAPVYRNEKHDFCALSRYDDVLRGLLDHETFVSSHGDHAGDHHRRALRDIPMMIMMDPPEHTRLRKLVSRAFTPRRIADLEAKIATLANDFLDTVEGQDEFDYVEHVRRPAAAHRDPLAGRLPRRATRRSSASGPTRACTSRKAATMRTATRIDRSSSSENGEINNEAFAILPELMEQRRAGPAGRPASPVWCTPRSRRTATRAHATLEEILGFVQLISSAGTETVARLLGFGAVTLAALPRPAAAAGRRPVADAQRGRGAAALRGAVADPVALGRARRRVPRRPSSRAGSKLSLLNGAARPRRAPLPGPRLLRRAARHRPSARVRVRQRTSASAPRWRASRHASRSAETLKRFPTWEIDESRLECVHTATVRGYKSVPMRVR